MLVSQLSLFMACHYREAASQYQLGCLSLYHDAASLMPERNAVFAGTFRPQMPTLRSVHRCYFTLL
jgi:hypothetical protein